MSVLPRETGEELQRLHTRIHDLERRLVESAEGEQSLILQLGERDKRLAEANTFRSYLIALGNLNGDEDAYFCAYEEDCKECIETDWAICLGYNVKLAAEKADVALRAEAEG